MEKPKGYDELNLYGKMKKYLVFLNGQPYTDTSAVSTEKAANHVRFQIYRESSGWWDVPPIEAFDCIEI